MNITFAELTEVCKKRGAIRENKWMCCFKNRQNAKSWDDWQECSEANCPLSELKPIENISFDDILKELNRC